MANITGLQSKLVGAGYSCRNVTHKLHCK